MKRSAWRYLWKSEDIRRKLLITLLLLVLYRLAANIPVPGTNRAVIAAIGQSGSAQGNLFNLLDLLSGGTVSRFSILAMGVYPYITAQIILQLLVPIIPALERRMKENPREGQKFIERWTIILTVPMAALSAIGQINIFNSYSIQSGSGSILANYGWAGANLLPTLTTIISMIGGTMLGVWLGQLISEYGIPNQGLSLIIFAGIVSRIPSNLVSLLADKTNGWWMLLLVVAILVVTIFAIVYVQQGRRNVVVFFPGRRIGNRMSMPVKSNLPLMVNMAGMIPLIFASSLLIFPATIGGFLRSSSTAWVASIGNFLNTTLSPSSTFYWIFYFILVVAFTYFYTDVIFRQQNLADTLQKQGGYIPGIRPGKRTEDYLNKVLVRITLVGALFLGFVAILPWLVNLAVRDPGLQNTRLLITSSGLLIVVGVVLDTMKQIEAQLMMRHYEGFIR